MTPLQLNLELANTPNTVYAEPEQAHITELPQKVVDSLARHGIINLLEDEAMDE